MEGSAASIVRKASVCYARSAPLPKRKGPAQRTKSHVTGRVTLSGQAAAQQRETDLTFPLPVILALTAIGTVGGIAVWGLVAVLRAKSLTEAQRMLAAGVIVLVVALLTMWGIFAWPAY